MQSVPKIVTDRLRTAPPALNHPDADVLTAFSERSLPDAERATVLEHLARCGNCRDIIALALPDAEPTQQVLRPTSSGWLTWPVLRWGVVAVGIVAIASFGLGHYRRQTAPSMMTYSPSPVAKVAQNEAPSLPVPESAKERDKAPAVALPGDREGKTKQALAAPVEFDRLDQSGPLKSPETRTQTVGGIGSRRSISSGGAIGGPVPHGPKVQYQNSNSFQYNNDAQNNAARPQTPAAPLPYATQAPSAFFAANTPAPKPPQTAEVQSQNVQVGPQGQNQPVLQLETKPMPLQPTEGGQAHTADVIKAKETGLALSSNNKVLAGAAPPAPSGLTLRAPDASWTINSGALQRSFDQGKTWQTVDVNSAPGFASGANLAVETTSARTPDLKKDQAAKAAAIAPVFRAVAANGADVWAGGANGLLYHSNDSGAHWTRILPFAGSAVLTGDILRLDFSDALHGRLMTSTPEVWLTSDGGQTWQKQ